MGTGSTCTGSVSAGTCTVNVIFTPRAPGQRFGAVQLTSGGSTVATALLYGTGTGPAVAFPGNAATVVLGSGFNNPQGIAVDGAGNLFVADTSHYAVKEIVAVGGSIPANPTVRTLYGSFMSPVAVAVDGAGDVFVADSFGGSVMEMVAVGGSIPANSPTIRTVSNGFSYPTGVAVDGAGNVFVAEYSGNAVKEIVAVGGSIPANSPTILTLGSGFHYPAGVAVDGAGNVFVADYGNYSVKEIMAVGGSIPATNPTIRTLASQFGGLNAVSVDGAGNVFVADRYTQTVTEIMAVGGSIPATSPTILSLGSNYSNLMSVAVDGAGNVFVADSTSNRVSEILLSAPPNLNFASTSVGNASSGGPQTVTLQNVGNTNLTFPIRTSGTNPTLSQNYQLGNTSTCPQLTTNSGTAGTLAPGTCTAIISFAPVKASAAAGSLTFFDNSGNVATASQTVTLTGSAPAATGTTAQTVTFTQPVTPARPGTTATLSASSTSGLAVILSVVSGPATISGTTVTYTAAGTVVLEADQNGNNTYSAATAVQRTVTVINGVGFAGAAQTATVTIANAGTLGTMYVLTTGQPNLDYTFTSGGTCATGTAYAAAATCTVNYIFTPRAPGQRMGAVQLVANDGTTVMGTTLLTGTGTGAAVVFPANPTVTTLGTSFSNASGAAVDSAGNVFVADSNGVEEILAVGGSIPANPTVNTLGGGLSYLNAVALDGAGNVYVVDYNNNDIEEILAVGGSIPANPSILTLGTNLTFGTPSAVAVDGAGNVFVADSGYNVVKEIVAVNGSIPANNPTIRTLGSGF